MHQLSGLDSSFLYLETPNMHMHVGGVLVLDPATAKQPFSIHALRRVIEDRIHLIPTLRRKLLTVPFDLDFPYWIDDPEFDLDFHVRHIAVPPPGGLEQLADLVSRIFSIPLDRNHPLWELYLVEGLGNIPEVGPGKVALIAKVHHASIDGASGREILTTMIDLSPEVKKLAPADTLFAPDAPPGLLELSVRTSLSLVKQPLRLVEVLPRAFRIAFRLRDKRREADYVPPPLPFTAPRAPFNKSITPHRKLAAMTLDLADIKAIKDKAGCKVNDVILAVLAGALRDYLVQRGELPADPLVAMVPISVRTDEEKGTLGNKVSAMLASLATHVADPAKRLQMIVEGTSRGKSQHKTIGANTLQDLAQFATPALAAQAARLYARTKIADRLNPPFNLVITNVPGPTVPIYMAGARMVASYGVGPIIDGVGLIVAVQSYIDRIDLGFTACKETTPDLWRLAFAVRPAMEALKAAVIGGKAPPALTSKSKSESKSPTRPARRRVRAG